MFGRAAAGAAGAERAARDPARLPNAPGKDLGDQLEAIRTGRWATSVGEREEGISAVATAIVDSRDRVVAALCISAPTTRLPASRFGEMRPSLELTAAEISRQLQRG